MYVYINREIFIYLYIYISIYKYIYIFIYLYIHIHEYLYMIIYLYVYISIYLYTYIFIYLHGHICKTFLYLQIYIFAYYRYASSFDPSIATPACLGFISVFKLPNMIHVNQCCSNLFTLQQNSKNGFTYCMHAVLISVAKHSYARRPWIRLSFQAPKYDTLDSCGRVSN